MIFSLDHTNSNPDGIVCRTRSAYRTVPVYVGFSVWNILRILSRPYFVTYPMTLVGIGQSRKELRNCFYCALALPVFTQPVQPLYSNAQEKQHAHGTRMHTQPIDYPDEVESFGRYSWPGLDGDPDSGVPFLRPYTYNKKHALSHLEGPY